MSLPTGTYVIQRSSFQAQEPLFITLPDGREGAPATVLPPRDNPEEQEWEIKRSSDGRYTIGNNKAEKYLGFGGNPEFNKRIVATGKPQEWEFRPFNGPFGLLLVPVDGPKLVVDVAPATVYPPLLALMPLREGDDRQAWQFIRRN
ncbi:hypothetical protein BOTBODRAFT_189115 [Botryobasidium botryosum FD-172 SS1]|uniref:Ricin B lectin domain-containing protein n=1 Tax=Botryobasidium botryosum (strain FD-172 SS1) TaxID=930990 RepID=A0A067ML61_BOTB1|nr:hypothetical protein BOTBODRAFT_189115 [Botryobasidium botryosum FD-172 SS1]